MSASVPYSSEQQYPAETRPGGPVTPAPSTEPSDISDRVAWWLALGASVFSVVLGIVIITWPEATLRVVAALFGAWLVTYGVIRIVQSITGSVAEAVERAVLGVIGFFFVVAGVIALRNLLASIALVVTLIGLMCLIGGILQIASAFGSHGGLRVWNIVFGGLGVVAALILLIWPSPSLTVVVYVTGTWMIFMGLIQLAMVLWARKAITA